MIELVRSGGRQRTCRGLLAPPLQLLQRASVLDLTAGRIGRLAEPLLDVMEQRGRVTRGDPEIDLRRLLAMLVLDRVRTIGNFAVALDSQHLTIGQSFSHEAAQ
jgi:hypothetical protein